MLNLCHKVNVFKVVLSHTVISWWSWLFPHTPKLMGIVEEGVMVVVAFLHANKDSGGRFDESLPTYAFYIPPPPKPHQPQSQCTRVPLFRLRISLQQLRKLR